MRCLWDPREKPFEHIGAAPRSASARRGFTLFEILIVALLLGVLLGVSWPRLSRSFKTLELQGFSSGLAHHLEFWRQRAMVTGKIFFLEVDAGFRQVVIREQDQPKQFKVYPIPAGIRLEVDKEEVYFYPDGTMDSVRFRASLEDGTTCDVVTKGALGGVQVRTS